MDPALLVLVLVILLGVAFDFTNGFHDSANAIATSVATRVLSPTWAHRWSSCLHRGPVRTCSTSAAAMVRSLSASPLLAHACVAATPHQSLFELLERAD